MDKLADKISVKVLEKLEPRFVEIEKKLSNDNSQIDENTRELSEHRKRMEGLESGQRAICRGVLALLNHALHNGNSDEMEKAKQGMDNYLIEK